MSFDKLNVGYKSILPQQKGMNTPMQPQSNTNGGFTDPKNTAIQQQKKNTQPKYNTKTQYRTQLQRKANFLLQSLSNSGQQVQLDTQVKRQIKKKYFSPQAIEQQMKKISFKLFFYPTQQLKSFIQAKTGSDYEGIIYKCVALRHGDLYILKQKTSQQQIKQQIIHIMDNLISWGPYFIDLKKLQHISTSKKGNTKDKTYYISQFQVQIRISDAGISFKFFDKYVTPFQMKNTVLKQMAIQSLRKKAIKVYFQFLKKQNIMM